MRRGSTNRRLLVSNAVPAEKSLIQAVNIISKAWPCPFVAYQGKAKQPLHSKDGATQ